MRSRFPIIRQSLAFLGLLAATNGSAAATVAMEKYFTGYSKETAAVVNGVNGTLGLYEPGFNIGHRLFYGESQHTTLQNLGFPAIVGKALDQVVYDPFLKKVKEITPFISF